MLGMGQKCFISKRRVKWFIRVSLREWAFILVPPGWSGFSNMPEKFHDPVIWPKFFHDLVKWPKNFHDPVKWPKFFHDPVKRTKKVHDPVEKCWKKVS